MSSAAARVGDPISHTSALDGLLAGLAIGAGVALAGIAIAGTGGLAAVAIVGAGASSGAAIGQMFGSMNTSEAGAITSGSPNVRINGIPAARAHVDFADCSKHSHKEVVATGSGGVRINGFPAARVDDKTACDGVISSGSSNVRIGGGTVQTDEINPEVPEWLQWTILGVGALSTGYFLWVAPALTMGGIAGGFVGEKAGSVIGGDLYGEGSNEQAIFALGGAVVGGLFGARGGQAFHSRYRITTQGLGSNLGNIKISRRPSEFTGLLKGEPVTIPNTKVRPLEYVKRPTTETMKLRKEFVSVRKNFLKDLSSTPEKRSILRSKGFTEAEITRMKSEGLLPNREWQVHHNKPLDDSGNNSFDNLTLIKNDPYHKVITNYQKTTTGKMSPGDVKTLDWPFLDTSIYP